MINIGLVLHTHPHQGGAFQYQQAMLEAVAFLPREEFQVFVVYTHDKWKTYLKDYDVPARKVALGPWAMAFGKVLRSVGLPMVWRKMSLLFLPVTKELRQRGCDLWISPPQDAFSSRVSALTVGIIHDLMHRYEKSFPEVSANGEYKHREKAYTQMCKWAKGILVDSEVGKEQVVESYGVDPNKIHILPFVPSRYICDETSPDGFDQRYQLPQKFIFYPAQFWEHKNHKNLVNAVHILRQKYQDLSLIFLGSQKNAYRSIFDMVQRLKLTKNIFFIGYVPDRDISEFYRRARAMVMPTFFGPTNIPPTEANALGCPVAVSKVYGMVEQLGDAALYFDPSSIEQIANVIEEIWTDDDLCIELRQRGLRRAGQWNQVHFNKRLHRIIMTILKDSNDSSGKTVI